MSANEDCSQGGLLHNHRTTKGRSRTCVFTAAANLSVSINAAAYWTFNRLVRSAKRSYLKWRGDAYYKKPPAHQRLYLEHRFPLVFYENFLHLQQITLKDRNLLSSTIKQLNWTEKTPGSRVYSCSSSQVENYILRKEPV